MKNLFSWCASVFLILLFILGLGWVLYGNQFFMFQFFAPKVEQVRRNVFEESKAYRQGLIQEMNSLHVDYIKASPDQKEGLRTIILHKAADIPPEILGPDLNAFLNQLRNERNQWKP